jgi:hypothetical protein
MEPIYELRLAALNKLRQVAALTAIVGTKIYDRVPERQAGGVLVADVTSPYISMGPTTAISEDADCIDGLEVTFQIDAWSWGSGLAYGSVQASQIAGEVRKALHDVDLELSVNALVSIRHEMTRILRESDGITNHAVIQFTAVVETN